MHRRQLLVVLGATGSIALSGCGALVGEGTETAAESGSPAQGTTDSRGSPSDPGGTRARTTTSSRTATPTARTEPPTATGRPGTVPTRQTAKLVTEDDTPGGKFGASVAVSREGTTALVGAPNDASLSGSASVFGVRDGDWTHNAELSDGDGSLDSFGAAVALSDDGATALVGAETDGADNAGSVAVFVRDGYSWVRRTRLRAAETDAGDRFGSSVALSADGEVAVVGAPGDEDPNGRNAGAAYVFESGDGDWHQRAALGAADGGAGDEFGSAVALSSDGTTVLVGALHDADPNGRQAGSAYVFDVADGDWRQTAKLVPGDGDSKDTFGWSVALSGDGATAVVGAPDDEDPNRDAAGSAYVFDAAGGQWEQSAKLVPDEGDPDDMFGISVALSGDGTTALVGALGDEDPNGHLAGSASVFERARGAWVQRSKLAADDGADGDQFGSAVDLSGEGTTAVVGALYDETRADEDAGSEFVSGSAYVFE